MKNIIKMVQLPKKQSFKDIALRKNSRSQSNSYRLKEQKYHFDSTQDSIRQTLINLIEKSKRQQLSIDDKFILQSYLRKTIKMMDFKPVKLGAFYGKQQTILEYLIDVTFPKLIQKMRLFTIKCLNSPNPLINQITEQIQRNFKQINKTLSQISKDKNKTKQIQKVVREINKINQLILSNL